MQRIFTRFVFDTARTSSAGTNDGTNMVRRISSSFGLSNLCTALLTGSVLFGMTAYASSTPSPYTDTLSDAVDLSEVTVDPYEFALTQVLAEICPPLLNAKQKRQFSQVYNTQMKAFLPNLDVSAALRQIGSQRDYRGILQNVRKWTLSYPTAENKALCIEYAESTI